MADQAESKGTISNSIFQVAKWPLKVSQALGYLPVKLDRFQNSGPTKISGNWLTYPKFISISLTLISITTAFAIVINAVEIVNVLKALNRKSENVILLVSIAWVITTIFWSTCTRFIMLSMQGRFADLWIDLVGTLGFIVVNLNCNDQFKEHCKRLTDAWRIRLIVNFFLFAFVFLGAAYSEIFYWNLPAFPMVLDLTSVSLSSFQIFSTITMELFLQFYSLMLDLILEAFVGRKSCTYWTGEKLPNKGLVRLLLKSFMKVETQILEFNKVFSLRMSLEVSNVLVVSIFGGYFLAARIITVESWTLDGIISTGSTGIGGFCFIYFLFRICGVAAEISAKGREFVRKATRFYYMEAFQIEESPAKVFLSVN